MPLNQVQLDELYATLSAVKDGEMSEADAIERLSTSLLWVWTAIDSESKLLLSVQVGCNFARIVAVMGARSLAIARCWRNVGLSTAWRVPKPPI